MSREAKHHGLIIAQMDINDVLDFLVMNNIRQIEIDLDEKPLWARWTEKYGSQTVVRKHKGKDWYSVSAEGSTQLGG